MARTQAPIVNSWAEGGRSGWSRPGPARWADPFRVRPQAGLALPAREEKKDEQVARSRSAEGFCADQPIADAERGQDARRARGILLDLRAQELDVHAQVVHLIDVLGAPDRAQDLPVRDHTVGVARQGVEQIELGAR